MFSVEFFTHSKKVNSTSRPATGSGTTYACTVRTGTSILNPVIELDIGTQSAPVYNYCYIPAFSRYYFVSDWTFGHRLWTASLSVDVLATYKTEIGGSSLYVLRSAAEFDDRIPDTLYPTKSTTTSYAFNGGSVHVDGDSGAYVVGIVGRAPEGALSGSVSYMVMDESEFTAFRNFLFADSPSYWEMTETEQNVGLSALGQGLIRLFYNPFQYVVSCKWFPITPSDLGRAFWSLGYWSTGSDLRDKYRILNKDAMIEYTTSLTLSKHPEADTRGSYLNAPPYAEHHIFIPTVGLVPLDITQLVNYTAVDVTVRIDPVSGKSYAMLTKHQASVPVASRQILEVYESNFAVDIQLANDTTAVEAARAVATTALGSTTGLMAEQYMGSAVNVGSAALSGFSQHVSSIGQADGFAFAKQNIMLYSTFYNVPEDDNADAGKPLCKIRQISTLPGYNVCREGDIALASTADENDMVRGYLTGGFFFE